MYQHNKGKLKSYFDFPLINDNNEIWYLVYDGNEKALNLLSEKIKPFTKKDFDQYFDKLFSKKFVTLLLKIKTDELYRKGETETAQLKEDKSTTSKMYATFEQSDMTLSLNLSSKTVIKDKNGETEDGGEYGVIYIFRIIKNGQLKFKQVRLAG